MEGSNRLGVTFNSFKAYIRYQAMYIMVGALLTKLQFVVDRDAVKELAKHGYNITLTQNDYAPSIYAAFNKLQNINSKIASKQTELEQLMKGGEAMREGLNFGNLIAEVSTALGFRVGTDILLSEYNSYVKLIRSKK